MSAQQITGFLLLLVFIFTLDGCKRVRPDTPVQEEFEAPIPDPVSFMAGNLTFNIRDLEAKINKSLSITLVPEETFEGRKGEAWRLRVERTGPVRIRYADRKVYFSAPLQVWYSNPIGLRKADKRKSRPLCALSVTFNSPVGVGSSWRLATKSRFENYEWTQEPKVQMLGIKINVKGLAEKILDKRKADIEAAIDKAVHDGLHLNREVSKVWRDMQNPIRIAKVPENIWLMPKPFSIAAAPVYGNARQITVPLQIAFRVKTRIGPKPMVDSLEYLPKLLRRNELPDSTRLEVLAFIPYAEVNQVLARTLAKQKLDLVGGNLTIKSASIYGSGRKLILKADVGGRVKGTLFFHGSPVYDTLTNTLGMKDVDFDVDTKERLLATADWLLHDHLRDTIQAAMVIPLRQQITSIPTKIETAFANAKVGQKTALNIDTFRLIPQRIVVRPDGIQVLIKVQSKVAVKVKRL
ncbi:DUF4403 family protein [Spirosoma pollinicola]|uniref:DUF4403 domain-containing protein n=1 Tax=Spirosoma pollinicola TaxID=2057025 RepID=A0A2K8YYN8_9BACT|nr:DUF4403 family protein [Spirosoma pollinicola]AUD02741.1 hypothetical protein CWM47_13395 [Spirosoma pollinicola]